MRCLHTYHDEYFEEFVCVVSVPGIESTCLLLFDVCQVWQE